MVQELFPDYQVILVPGLQNSGPDHWQTRWQRAHPEFYRLEQDNWDHPDLAGWTAGLDQLRALDPRPALLVAHSFGCLSAVCSIARDPRDIGGALLVAPADPDRFGLARHLPARRLPCPTIVVSSTNDPWMSAQHAARWAACWGSELADVGERGHINAESGLGDWQWGQSQLQRLFERAHNGRAVMSA